MKLGEFVHGRKPQNGLPSLQNQDQGNIRNSRQRNAEMARVDVPPTKLNETTFPASSGAYPNSQAQIQAQAITTATGASGGMADESHWPEPRDMFDTDLEGVDDSTTTISLAREPEAEPTVNKSLIPRAVHRREASNSNQTQRPRNSNSYKSIAERIRELDSDDDEDDDTVKIVDYQQRQQYDIVEPQAEQGMKHSEQPFEESATDVDRGTEPLSWQRIEEILRGNKSQPGNAVEEGAVQQVEEPPYYPHNYSMNNVDLQLEQAVLEEKAVPSREFDVQPTTPQRSLQRLPTRGRFGSRSRFATPRSNTTGVIGSRPIPRPSSAPIPLSPDQRPTLNTTYSTNNYHSSLHPTRDTQYINHTPGGAFDTTITDLSVLDSTDISDNNTTDYPQAPTFPSPDLSTLSPISSKRPLSDLTSDYPPNILQTKSFSDLQNESFDYNPTPIQPIFPPQDPPLPLEEKLTRLKTLTDGQRRVFFSSLTIAEWEDSGDWLIDQFSSILQKTKEARQVRRKIASVFEAEVKRRHDGIEDEGKDIKKRLDDMKMGGMGVLKGHSP